MSDNEKHTEEEDATIQQGHTARYYVGKLMGSSPPQQVDAANATACGIIAAMAAIKR